MFRNGTLKIVVVAALAFGGATATAQDQTEQQKDPSAQRSGMMMQGHPGRMGMEMGPGMMGGMGPMMGMGHGTCPMMGSMGSTPGMGQGMGMGMGMGPMMSGMGGADLTDEQQEQLAEFHGQQAKEQYTLMQKMQEPRQRLQELMTADQLDIEAITQAYDNLADVRKEAFLSHLQAKQRMQEIMGQ